jgi:putative membrane protein
MTYHFLLQEYGFGELWNLNILGVSILIGFIYILLTGHLRNHFSNSSPVGVGQKVSFITGLFVFYLAMGSPLHLIGHEFLFSAHMLEQALIYVVMPPLLLIGTPKWFIRFLLEWKKVKKLLFLLVNPMVAMVLFNVLFSLYHLPILFDYINASSNIHTWFHILLTIGAFAMWWPIIAPLPELDKINGLYKICYIFVNGLLLTPVCALIIFSNSILYTTYSNVPELLPFLSKYNDQQLGGVLMKVVQEVTSIVTIAIIFFKWASKEKSSSTIDRVDSDEISISVSLK